MRILNFEGEEVFIDANVFLFNALDDPKFGEIATIFLERIENGEIRGIVNSTVLNEVLFKILMAEASKHIEDIDVWKVKKKLRSKEFSKKVYSPVKEYLNYIEELSLINLKIVPVTHRTIQLSIDLGEKYGLLTSDSFHIATMREQGIKYIATDDLDFERVDNITVLRLEE